MNDPTDKRVWLDPELVNTAPAPYGYIRIHNRRMCEVINVTHKKSHLPYNTTLFVDHCHHTFTNVLNTTEALNSLN